jgi:Sulfotransferase family
MSGKVYGSIADGYEDYEQRCDKFSLLMWHVHYSDKYRYVYVDTAKVACSTIKRTLSDAEQGFADKSSEYSNINEYGYSDFLMNIHNRHRSLLRWPTNRNELKSFLTNSCLVFCFVRNPYTRVLSTYLDKFGENAERMRLFSKEIGIHVSENTHISFVDFLRRVALQNPASMNPHWRPQSFHLVDNAIDYDFIGRFENFANDFNDVLKKIGSGIGDFFSSVTEHKTRASELISDLYADPACVRLVREIYAEDFRRFGYSEDPMHALR